MGLRFFAVLLSLLHGLLQFGHVGSLVRVLFSAKMHALSCLGSSGLHALI